MNLWADGRLLRSRTTFGSGRVTNFELFFDLVYVFAVTQISHLLLAHLSPAGALQSLMLLLAIWWAWVYTAWATNWLDPDQPAVRFLLIGVMFGSLLMASAIPDAFLGSGLLFGVSYTLCQTGRSAFVVWAVGNDPLLRENFQRIFVWNLLAGVVWILGGLAAPGNREVLWAVALMIDYAGPISGFQVPKHGKSRTADWSIIGSHLAERFQLFIILAIGESIVVTGATFGGLPVSPATITALIVSLFGSVAFWWIYFTGGGERAEESIAEEGDPGRIGRSAYTYAHLPMVAGIILAAVGDELALVHPRHHPDMAELLVLILAPILFLVGHFLFRWYTFHVVSWPHLFIVAAIAMVGIVGTYLSLLLISAVTTVAVILVAAWTSRAHGPQASPATD